MLVLVAPDPIVEARTWLRDKVPATVEGALPARWDWSEPLVLLRDGGGSAERSRVLTQSRLTVETSAPTRAAASVLARRVYGLLRAWPDHAPGVYWDFALSVPAYSPEPNSGTPSYVFTVALSFRSSLEDVTAS